MTEIEYINKCLGEAVYWCSARVDAKRAWETSRLLSFKGAEKLKDYNSTFKQRQEGLEELILMRRNLIGESFLPINNGLSLGKILRYEIDNTDSCGLSTAATNGYIDDNDMPGWDTWFHIYQHTDYGVCILSWVPPAFVELAEEAIYMNPVDCISFVELDDEINA